MTDHKADISLALVIFTNRFAALVQEGISLVRTLLLLEECPEPYGEAANVIRLGIQDGSTLSEEMEKHPSLFSPFYIGLVRTGEVGGVLELTLRRCADAVLKEYRLMGRWSSQEQPIFLVGLSQTPPPRNWSQLSNYQRTAIQFLFCESFGTMLSYGVPILRTIDELKRLLPIDQAARLDEVRNTIREGKQMDLGRLGMLPEFVTAIAARGEETGRLDAALLKAADVLERELDARVAFLSL